MTGNKYSEMWNSPISKINFFDMKATVNSILERLGICSFKENKIKSIPLKVSAPFHCSLMKPAADIMKDKINNTNFKNPVIQIINNVNAKVENDSNLTKQLLIDQISSTVKWRQSIINIHKSGVKN